MQCNAVLTQYKRLDGKQHGKHAMNCSVNVVHTGGQDGTKLMLSADYINIGRRLRQTSGRNAMAAVLPLKHSKS